MTTVLKLISHDDLFHRLTTDKVLLNDRDIFSTEEKEILDQFILKNYSDDNLSLIPACHCEELKGTYYVGEVCPTCGTTVTSSIDDNLSFLLWLKAPQTVERFISPHILAILLDRYKITQPRVPLIRYIMIPNFLIDKKQQKKNLPLLEKLDHLLAQAGIKRGYNSFVQNFFRIIEILESEFVKAKAAEKAAFMDFLIANKDVIFSEYLPFPNKIMFVMDTTELGRFIDKTLLNPINVIRRVTGIDRQTKPSSVKQLKVANSLLDLAEFYVGYMKEKFFKKPALVRQHISSTRSHFTGRAVITTIPGPHHFKEIWLPWSLAVSLLREHILNRLKFKYGYSYKTATRFIMFHNRIYSPILDEIFHEILDATATVDPILGEVTRGLPMLFNRNPSLHRGSIQSVLATKIKTDTDDNTISMSLLIAPSFNADMDGDMMSIILVLTEKVLRNMDNFDPHHNILTLSGPNEFSSNIKLPKTVIGTLANFMSR